MPAERIIAIDFGTSTSVVRVKRYQDGKPIGDRLETKPVTFNMGSTVVPTLIQRRDTGESLYFGYDAEIPRRNTVILRNFKIEIEALDPAVRGRARELTADFFRYLYKTYREQSLGGHLGENDDRERTVISYPVKWSEDTKKFMLETAKNAGFPNVEGQDEAQAAIQAVTIQSEKQLRDSGYLTAGQPANILLIDMGAGTTDLVLCRHTPGDAARTEILATWPHRAGTLFGGQEVDELLRSYVKGLLPADSAEKVLKRLGADKFKAWKEHDVSPALARDETVNEFSALDDRLEDMELNIDYSIDRWAFEDFAQGYLRGFPELVSGCLNEAGMTGDQVDLVVLTGGHSQWYFVREMLGGRLDQFGVLGLTKIQADPDRVVSIALPQETVALGLVYGPLRAALPKPEPKLVPKPAQKLEAPKIITLAPPALYTFPLTRPDRLVRPTLPGKDADIEEIKTFYRRTQWGGGGFFLRYNGTVVSEFTTLNRFQNWKDITSLIHGAQYTVGLRSDGGVITGVVDNRKIDYGVQNWRDIVAIDSGFHYIMGLQSDGTVITNGEVQGDVQHWQEIVAIACGLRHMVGLRSDGTVVATGRNVHGQCDTHHWRGIVAIACGWEHTVSLCSDGTVMAIGSNKYGQCNVQDWKDIVFISCGNYHTVGLRSDGTAVAVGDTTKGQCGLSDWKNILSISASGVITTAILNDGSVIRTDFQQKTVSHLFKEDETVITVFPTKTLPFKLF